MTLSRRGFLKGILLTATAPAIVRADSLMKVISWERPLLTESSLEDAIIRFMQHTDSRGLHLALHPRHLIVPEKYKKEARAILAKLPSLRLNLEVVGGTERNFIVTDTNKLAFAFHDIDLALGRSGWN